MLWQRHAHVHPHTYAMFLAFAETQEPRIATRMKVRQQFDDKDQIVRSARLIPRRRNEFQARSFRKLCIKSRSEDTKILIEIMHRMLHRHVVVITVNAAYKLDDIFQVNSRVTNGATHAVSYPLLISCIAVPGQSQWYNAEVYGIDVYIPLWLSMYVRVYACVYVSTSDAM